MEKKLFNTGPSSFGFYLSSKNFSISQNSIIKITINKESYLRKIKKATAYIRNDGEITYSCIISIPKLIVHKLNLKQGSIVNVNIKNG